LSHRDRLIVARHEMPGLEFGRFQIRGSMADEVFIILVDGIIILALVGLKPWLSRPLPAFERDPQFRH
jgi:hypothetical protein